MMHALSRDPRALKKEIEYSKKGKCYHINRGREIHRRGKRDFFFLGVERSIERGKRIFFLGAERSTDREKRFFFWGAERSTQRGESP